MPDSYHPKEIRYIVDAKGCHVCTSHCRSDSGYPLIVRNRRNIRLSRYLYEKEIGKIPEGQFLLHSCDNPACINLEHLRPGSHQENMKDMVARGRSTAGEKHFGCKLNEGRVWYIRNQTRFSMAELAEMFGMHPMAIYPVRKGKKWKER